MGLNVAQNVNSTLDTFLGDGLTAIWVGVLGLSLGHRLVLQGVAAFCATSLSSTSASIEPVECVGPNPDHAPHHMVDEALRTETIAAVKSIRQLGDRAANLAAAGWSRVSRNVHGRVDLAAHGAGRVPHHRRYARTGGLSFQDQIDDDVEIFLPDDAESTDLLLEVREEWSTDIAIIYIQTDNARLGQGLGDNISDEAILREISWVEGDDENKNSGATSRGIDWNKNDRGREDGILWILSPAQLIKEANSADGRFNNSMCEHGVQSRIPVSFDCDLPGGGAYAIPDQDRIDALVDNPGVRSPPWSGTPTTLIQPSTATWTVTPPTIWTVTGSGTRPPS